VTPQSKTEFAGPGDSPRLFARIARRYDVLNRLMSLGRDRHWRRLAAEAIELPPNGRMLDVGVGTGDMALALMASWPDATVVGVDPTAPMMAVGRQKLENRRIRWSQADGLHLPFPDQHFDAAVSAFVLRNVTDVPLALAEQRRVVRDGGTVVSLEMSWPRTPVLGPLFRFYFADLMPCVTGLLSGQPAAYRYLPRSVRRFLTPQELQQAMEEVGLRNVHYRRLALGTVTLHVGRRAPPDFPDHHRTDQPAGSAGEMKGRHSPREGTAT
jgi:demethylmenaquinone methyltransferase/2-methoxy-6-polyprenyl-1,4-benzoquinol methylase